MALATALPEQRITGRAALVSLDLNGFSRRMKDAERGVNHGYFGTPEDFEFRKPYQITQMVEGHPALFLKHNIFNPREDVCWRSVRIAIEDMRARWPDAALSRDGLSRSRQNCGEAGQ